LQNYFKMTSNEKTGIIIQKIDRAFTSGAFKNYIEYIRFPFFKNLKLDSRIDFNFPFTVLTGINGSGKSSALHALFGAPKGKSTSSFWFSTSLDPITTIGGRKPTFIYGYKDSSDNIVEVIKTRVGKSKGADYWEPSRPIRKYGMHLLPEGARNPTIEKDVIYLDFRSELSAFDKYFYFGNFHSSITLKTKQDVLRKYSKHIERTIRENRQIISRNRKSGIPIILSASAIKAIAEILGKPYMECKIINHDFYDGPGSTVYFITDHLQYSEAFAGRGEYAVVKLVHAILGARDHSLIILDEPEVSLHPAAQENLRYFLLEQCLSKKLQIVVSTHAPKLVEYLPKNAIKLFYTESEKFNILNRASYLEVFDNIGERISSAHQKNIIVEDKTAKTLTEAIIKEIGGDYPLLFNVLFFPGGAEHAKKSAVHYSQEREINKYLLLDGDKRKPHFDPSNFTRRESNDMAFLEARLNDSTGSDFRSLGFRLDGSTNGGNQIQKKEFITDFLSYQTTNMDYLPLNIPEEFIWDEEAAKKILEAVGKEAIEYPDDFKERFLEFSTQFFGKRDSETVEQAHHIFIQNFILKKDANYHAIVSILNKFHE
jgi:predicted ATPase